MAASSSNENLSPEQRQALIAAYRAGAKLSPMTAAPLIAALRAHWPRSIDALATDNLVAELLVNTPIYPCGLERALTAVRRSLLTSGAADSLTHFAALLAIQCHLNEYVWAEDAEESGLVERLAARVADLSATEAMLLAAYRPLTLVPGAGVLLGRGWEGVCGEVLREQILAAEEEKRLAAQIEALTAIRAGVSQAVQAQYEANPYPRWRTVAAVSPANQVNGIRAPDILIAGCGTGYQAITNAQRYPHSRIVAVDLSRASLAYGLRKAREAGCDNIAFFQGDILEVADWNQQFDIVECTGVLHHMSDPFEGARAVAERLRPGGLMKIALYSAIGRRMLQPAKAFARTFTVETIRELRQAICGAPPGDPLHEPERFVDFYAASSCRDLLFHVEEHEMDVTDLQRMTLECRLELLGFTVSEATLEAYRAETPDDPAATNLDGWAAFERAHPETFSDMYQFWTRKAA